MNSELLKVMSESLTKLKKEKREIVKELKALKINEGYLTSKGRMRLSEENQKLALKTCVEGILIGNYLTTVGKNPKEDIKTVRALNKVIV